MCRMNTTMDPVRRRLLAALALTPAAFALQSIPEVFAQGAGRAGGAARAAAGAPPDPQLISDLIAANHILVRKGIKIGRAHV